MSNLQDLTNQRFGRLVVIKREGTDNHGRVTWLCKCDCGNTKVIIGSHLKDGSTQSCGCLVKEIARNNQKKAVLCSTKHNQCYTRLYYIWASMKRRCQTPSVNAYKNYGGRGIKVCDEWQEFEPFRDWALANGYNEDAEYGECTIDRIDVDRNYEPSNCRWVTLQEQCYNRRSNHLITAFGKTMTITQWAQEINMKVGTLGRRIRSGWDIEKALTTPVRTNRTEIFDEE